MSSAGAGVQPACRRFTTLIYAGHRTHASHRKMRERRELPRSSDARSARRPERIVHFEDSPTRGHALVTRATHASSLVSLPIVGSPAGHNWLPFPATEAVKTPYVKVRLESRANMSTSQGPPGGLFGKRIVPAPAAVKDPAYGPLRALDRFGRGHGFSIMAGEPAPPQDIPLLFSLAVHTRGVCITQNRAPESRDGAEPFGALPRRTADGSGGWR